MSLRSVAMFRLFVLLTLFRVASPQSCNPSTTAPQSQYAAIQDHSATDSSGSFIYLGGVFSVHKSGNKSTDCGPIDSAGMQNLLAFQWAVRTYRSYTSNSNLGSIRFGSLAFDSCSSPFRMMTQVMNFDSCTVGYGNPTIPPSSLVAYVGVDSNDQAEALAEYVGNSGPSIVSSRANSPDLTDRTKYPMFLRTIPEDTVQVGGYVKLLDKLGWEYVQVVYSEDDFGEQMLSAFKEASDSSICVVYSEGVDTDAGDGRLDVVIANLKKNPSTRAVLVLTRAPLATRLLLAAQRNNAASDFTWLGTTSWAQGVDTAVQQAAQGSVGISLSLGDLTVQVNGFKDKLSKIDPLTNTDTPWMKEFWSDTFRCYFDGEPNPGGFSKKCNSANENMGKRPLDPSVPWTIAAVYSVLNGLDQAWKDTCQSSSVLCAALMRDPGRWARVFDSIRRVQRPRRFDQLTGGPLAARFDINHYRRPGDPCSLGYCFTKIASYDSASGSFDFTGRFYAYDSAGETETVTSACYTPCLPCDETRSNSSGNSPGGATTPFYNSIPGTRGGIREGTWIIALIVLAGFGVIMVIIFEVYLVCKISKVPFYKHWRTMWIGQLLLLAIFLCYAVLFAFVPIQTTATCGIIRFGIGAGYAMCFSVLLVKLMVILSSESVGYLKGIFQFLMFIFAWAVQIVVDVEWLILKPPGAAWNASRKAYVCTNVDFAEHCQSLVYVMFLICVCIILAIRTHRIKTNHREGIFIGLCAGFSVPIWVAWILLGLLGGNPEFEDPCLAFGLFVNVTILMFVMFLPKVRQLNNMGIEGIYAEDDEKDFAPSLVSPSMVGGPTGGSLLIPAGQGLVAGSVMGHAGGSMVAGPSHGYNNLAMQQEPVLLMPNGGAVYAEPAHGPRLIQTRQAPNALYLKHPGSHYGTLRSNGVAQDTTSVRSAPIGYVLNQRPQNATGNNTRVLRMTNDLTGRKGAVTPTSERRAKSEFNYNVSYGSNPRQQKYAISQDGTLKKSRSIQDLGSL